MSGMNLWVWPLVYVVTDNASTVVCANMDQHPALSWANKDFCLVLTSSLHLLHLALLPTQCHYFILPPNVAFACCNCTFVSSFFFLHPTALFGFCHLAVNYPWVNFSICLCLHHFVVLRMEAHVSNELPFNTVLYPRQL